MSAAVAATAEAGLRVVVVEVELSEGVTQLFVLLNDIALPHLVPLSGGPCDGLIDNREVPLWVFLFMFDL